MNVRNDPLPWWDSAVGCSRCGTPWHRYVKPYWAPDRRLCPTCCAELNRVFDAHNWPPDPGGATVLAVPV